MIYDTLAAAAALQVSKETIIRWCRTGRLPGAYLHNRSRRLGWRIPEAASTALRRNDFPVRTEANVHQKEG